MKSFIRRKRIIGYHKDNYSNFLKYAQKLISINHYDSDDKNELRQAIETTEPIMEKEWLLAQIWYDFVMI